MGKQSFEPKQLFQGVKNRFFVSRARMQKIYSAEPELQFRASNLLYVIIGASAVISTLLIVFAFASPSLIEPQAKKVFVPLFGIIGILFFACQKLVLRKKLNLARSLVLGMATFAVIGAISLTGGFPVSIASVAIFIPVIIAYSLFGGKISHMIAASMSAILIMQWLLTWKFGFEFPNFASKAMPETNSAIALGSTFVIVCFALVIFDVSNRKYIKKADAAMITKTNFLANTSHEIRTPMNGIIGLAEVMLKTTKLDQDQVIYMEAIHQSGTALMTIINDILDYSRLEGGYLELKQEPFNLFALTHEIRSLMTISAADNNVVIKCEYPADMPQRFIGDAGRLRQVLINLTANAVKFTENGQVLIRLSSTHTDTAMSTIRVEIEDTGIGIADDKIERIFERFNQADSGTTQKYGGTGLGLSISQKLVQAMGGRIGVKSSIGIGSTFWFEIELPAADALPGSLPSPQLQPHGGPNLGLDVTAEGLSEDKKQVLIVSNRMATVQQFGTGLRDNDYRVFHTGDPRDVTEWIDKQNPQNTKKNVILIDGALPPNALAIVRSICENATSPIKAIGILSPDARSDARILSGFPQISSVSDLWKTAGHSALPT